MSLKILELNDSEIKVGDHRGIHAVSPGFAMVEGNELIIGDRAEEQARLQPTKSYNKYWHELSVEPLNHGNHLRHSADIAYAHLVHLADIGEIESDTVLAVPGSFDNQQLAILLGLTNQSPIKAVGIVDSAVAAAAAVNINGPSLYLDLQLHQIAVTTLVHEQGSVRADSVIQIPGVGIQNFINLMMQQATDLFIEQCRFNPQHNAEYEQLLYNQLPVWLSQYEESQTNLVLELKTSDALHVAKMPKEGLIASLQGHYKKINQELEPLLNSGYGNLILGQRLAALPGYKASMPDASAVHVLEDGAVIAACLDCADSIVKDANEVHRVRSLPLSSGNASNIRNAGKESAALETDVIPTHLLSGNRAVPIDETTICNKSAKSSSGLPSKYSIEVEAVDLPYVLAQVSVNGSGVQLESGDIEFYLNSKRAKGSHQISLGDEIQFGENSPVLKAIQVQHG
ncbi:MAG: hypothetical protein AB8B95_04530 [Pseudohongiellaceae bacterium]